MYEYIKPTGTLSSINMYSSTGGSIHDALSYSFNIENTKTVTYISVPSPSGTGDLFLSYPPISHNPEKLNVILRARHTIAQSAIFRPSIDEINLYTFDGASYNLLATGTYDFDMRKSTGGYDTYYRNYEIPLSINPVASSVINWSTQQLALELVSINHPVDLRALDIVATPVQGVDTDAITLYTVSSRNSCAALNTSDGTINLDTKYVNTQTQHGRWQGDKYDWTGNLNYTGIFTKGFYQNIGGKSHKERSVVGDIGPTGLSYYGGNIQYRNFGDEISSSFNQKYSRGIISTDTDLHPNSIQMIQANVSLTGDFSVYLFRPPYGLYMLNSRYFSTYSTNAATAFVYSQSSSGVDWLMELGIRQPYATTNPCTYGVFRQKSVIPSGGGIAILSNFFESYLSDEELHHNFNYTNPYWNHCEMIVRYKHGSGVEAYRMSYSGAVREFGWSNDRVVGSNPSIFFRGVTRLGLMDGFITNEQINAINANSYFLDSYLNDLTADNSLDSSGTYIKTVFPSGNIFGEPSSYDYNLTSELLPYFLHHHPIDTSISVVDTFEYIADVYTEATGLFFRPEVWGVVGEYYGNYGIGYWRTEGKRITPGSIQRLSFTGHIVNGTGVPENPTTFLNNMSQENRDNALRTLGSWNVVYGQMENTPKEVRVYSSAVHVCGYTNPVATGTGIPLYIHGIAGSQTGSIDLFIRGAHISESGCTLYILNKEEASGSIPLYIVGGTETGAMPLFVQGESYYSSGSMSLFVNSTSETGTYNFISLFTDGTPFVTGSMNLFIQGTETGTQTGSMNLFIGSENNINNNISLFLMNSTSGINNSVTLFMNAPSGTDGAIPYSGGMPLFIQRITEGLAGGMTMYLAGPSGINAGMPLFINSKIEQGTTLYVDGIGVETSNVRCYIHGF